MHCSQSYWCLSCRLSRCSTTLLELLPRSSLTVGCFASKLVSLCIFHPACCSSPVNVSFIQVMIPCEYCENIDTVVWVWGHDLTSENLSVAVGEVFILPECTCSDVTIETMTSVRNPLFMTARVRWWLIKMPYLDNNYADIVVSPLYVIVCLWKCHKSPLPLATKLNVILLLVFREDGYCLYTVSEKPSLTFSPEFEWKF